MNENIQSSNKENPLVCLIQNPEQLRQRKVEAADLFKGAEELQELADGYAFRFADVETWATKLLEFILFEKNCCPFFTFEMAFEAQHGPLWLRLRGEEGVKEIAREMMVTSATESPLEA